MRVKKLTDLAVRQMKPDPNKRLEIPDPGKPGLYLLLQPSGHRSWAFRYRNKAGVQRKLNIGPFDKLGVAAAHIEVTRPTMRFWPAGILPQPSGRECLTTTL